MPRLMARVIYILLCLCTFPSTIDSSEEVSVTVSDDTVRGDWPTDRIDLKGVEVKLSEGEDVEGSASAKELIVRAFERLPKSEQDRIGFTTLREAQLSLPPSLRGAIGAGCGHARRADGPVLRLVRRAQLRRRRRRRDYDRLHPLRKRPSQLRARL